MESERDWGDEKRLSMRELAHHPDAPLRLHFMTWQRYADHGAEINGVVRILPTITVNGRRRTSLEAVRDWLNGVEKPAGAKNKTREGK